MDSHKKRRTKVPDKVTHLNRQAERARQLAVECGSQLVADLWGDHARQCERKAEALQVSKRKRFPEKPPS